MTTRKPFLMGEQFQNLKYGYRDSAEWHAAWLRSLQEGDPHAILSMLHVGTKFFDEPGVVSIYLKVADMHSSSEFYRVDERRSPSILAEKRWEGLSLGEVRRLVAKSAWEKLCHHFFRLEPHQFPAGRAKFLFDPGFAKVLVEFFTPWDLDWPGDCNVRRSDTDHGAGHAYGFLKQFVGFALEFDDRYWRPYYYRSTSAVLPPSEEFKAAVDYYKSQAGKITEIAVYHGLAWMLKGRWLSHSMRKMLLQMAMMPVDVARPPQNLSEAYAGINEEGQRDLSKYPQAAEVLLLYPVFRNEVRRYRQAVRRKHEKREEASRKLELSRISQQVQLLQAKAQELNSDQ